MEKKYDSNNPRFNLESNILETKRVVKVTKGGRRFRFTVLMILKNNNENSIAFSYEKGKQMSSAIQKGQKKSEKRMIKYWQTTPRTINKEIVVKYKATTVFIKPTPAGSGIKAGKVLNNFFKFLQIKDVTAKIIGSRNKMNVLKASFLAMSKLTNKKYLF